MGNPFIPDPVPAITQRADGFPTQLGAGLSQVGPGFDPRVSNPTNPFYQYQPGSFISDPRQSFNERYPNTGRVIPTVPSLATGDAGFGVQGPTYQRFDPTEVSTDALRDQFQSAWDKQQQLLDMDLEDIAAAYGGDLTALEKVLADLKKQRASSGAATADFRGDIDAIHGAAGTGELGDLPTSTAVEDVRKVYDGAEGELLDVLGKIDGGVSPEVAAAATGQLREMENYIEDSLRTDLNNIDNMHAAASQASQALATMAYADDAYGAARSQALLDAQLAKAVQDQADAIAAKKAEMAAAQDRARERAAVEFQYEQPSYDDSYQIVMEEYFRSQGLNSADTAKMMGLFNKIQESGGTGAMLNEATWRKALDEYNQTFILGQLGLQDRIENWQSAIIESAQLKLRDDDQSGYDFEMSRLQILDRQLEGIDLGDAFQTNNTDVLNRFSENLVRQGVLSQREADEMLNTGRQASDQFMSRSSTEYGYLRDAYTMSKEFDTNWEEILSGSMQFGDEELYVAPAGSPYAGYTFPVVGFVWHSGSGGYLYQDTDWQHMGVDIGAYRGSPVVAPRNSTVVDIGYNSISGNYIKVKDDAGLIHFFGHLESVNDLAVGGTVNAGTMIGSIGNTGNASGKGPVLHYEIRQGNTRLDPMDFINATGGQNVGDPPADYASRTYTGIRPI